MKGKEKFQNNKDAESFFRIYLILFITLLGCLSNIYSQSTEIKLEQISIRQGLSNNRVEAICQDRSGFMWFGTQTGLNRYDGYSVINYGQIYFFNHGMIHEDKDGFLWILPGTPGSVFRFDRNTGKSIRFQVFGDKAKQIFEADDGSIWIITQGDGIAKYRRESGSFQIYKNIPGDIYGLPDNNVNCMYEDREGNIWIGYEKGLCRFDRTTGKFFLWNYNLSLPVYTVIEDKEGFLWLGTNNGLCGIDPSRKSFKRYSENNGKGKNAIYYIYEDRRNQLWAANNGNIWRFDRITKKFTPFDLTTSLPKGTTKAVKPISEDNAGTLWIGINCALSMFNQGENQFELFKNNPEESIICSMYKDKSGVLWFGTMDEGVYRLDRLNKPFINVWNRHNSSILKKNKLNNSVTSIFKDNDDIIWIGKLDGLCRLDDKSGSLKIFTHKPTDFKSISGNFITQLAETSPGTLWVGTYSNGLNRFDKATGKCIHYTKFPNGLSIFGIVDLYKDKNCNLWASAGYSFEKFSGNSGTFTQYYDSANKPWINQIFEDRSSQLWIGTGNKLGTFNEMTDTYKYFVTDSAEYLNAFINGIHEDKQGVLWIATDIGLEKFNKADGKFTHITTANGLANSQIISILEDDHNNLWLLTPAGISKYNTVSGAVRNYDESDGVTIGGGAIYNPSFKAKNGEMFFGSFNGLIRFFPDSIKDNPFIPPVVITAFKIFNKDAELDSNISEKKVISLSHSENYISFEFAALNYTSPQKNQYAYKMEGFDKDWIYCGTRRFASYPNLEPGEYIFRVKGSNNDEIWNESGTSILIIVSPPWWRTTIAYILYFILILSAIYFTWKMQTRKLRLKHEYAMSKFEAEKLHEVDEMKSRFFTNISHEFRTPLTLILAPAKRIFSLSKNDEIKEEAELIYRNANKLNRLANQLLDISRIESGMMELNACNQNLIPVIKDTVSSFKSFAECKNILLTFNCAFDEIFLYLDKDKIDKILTNVISNAVKFTPANGSVNVEVLLNEKNVEIIISDTGIGIPKDKIDKIFDRFYQVDSGLSREHEGTGVGLSLTKELIELHKGKIFVDSEEGKGSIFKIVLLLGKGHLSPEEIVDPETSVCEGMSFEPAMVKENYKSPEIKKEKRITINQFKKTEEDTIKVKRPFLLIVEDNSDVRRFIIKTLKDNYEIIEAADGEEGLKKSFEHIPDLIISDIMMPKLDGIKLCEILKKDFRTSHIPLILLTAKATLNDKITGLETGADDYIMKPFEISEVIARIKNLLDQRKRIQEHFKNNGLFEHANSADEDNISSVDQKFLRKTFEIINRHIPDSNFSVEMLAEKLAVHRTLLYKKLIALTGEPPVELIRRVRLNKAAKLIELKSGNISEIAFEVGFNNPSYFTECFRKQFGINPLQYHKAVTGNKQKRDS